MDLYMSADMLYINFRWAHMRWFNNAHHWLHNVRFSQRRLVRAHIFQLLHSISQHGMMASWWQKKNCDGYEMMGGTTIWLSTLEMKRISDANTKRADMNCTRMSHYCAFVTSGTSISNVIKKTETMRCGKKYAAEQTCREPHFTL